MDFDSTIPPGGEGKITLKLNLKGYQGDVKKTATVSSNDPQSGKLVLVMQGKVKSLIEVRPTASITFRGVVENLHENVLEIVATPPNKFQIQKIETNLEEKIAHQVETVQAGTQYRLKVSNLAKQGNYNGFIKVYTDLPQKPELVIRVTGSVEGEISVKPQTLVVGKLAAQQPVRVGKVLVTSNRGKPFKVTKLTYDEKLLKVTQEPLPNGEGYSLDINANVEQITPGGRQQTVLTIETDTAPSEKQEVQVHAMHAAETPGAGATKPTAAGSAASKASPKPAPAMPPAGEQIPAAGKPQ
ncbi:MAG: OS_HP3 family (seleno)protein [Syntrophobacteraceae bacterium]